VSILKKIDTRIRVRKIGIERMVTNIREIGLEVLVKTEEKRKKIIRKSLLTKESHSRIDLSPGRDLILPTLLKGIQIFRRVSPVIPLGVDCYGK